MSAPLMIASITFLLTQAISATTRCVAHRGVHHQWMENSYISIDESFRQGIGGVEFDVMHTINGDAILMHDETLKRTAMNAIGEKCPLRKKVSALTLEEISTKCILKDRQPMPTLEVLIQKLKGHSMGKQEGLPVLFIELKDTPSMKTLKLIGDLLTFYPWNKVFVISFHSFSLSTMLRYFHTNIQTMLIESKAGPYTASLLTGLAFKTTIGPLRDVLQYLRSMGKVSYVWTKNSTDEIERMIEVGVDYIATDKPDLCQALLPF